MTSLADPPAPVLPARTVVRLLARRVHFVAGLLIAPFLFVLAVSGGVYAFSPQINDLVYAEELYVDEVGETPRPLDDQVRAAMSARSGDVTSVIVADDPERTTQMVLDDGTTVYVNPYTGGVQGELATVNGRPPVQVWLREFHGNLTLGEAGRLYSEFVASWLPVLVVGGVILWMGQRGRGRGRARLRGLHATIGIWAAVGLLAISVTGLTWSTFAGDRVDQVIDALDSRAPTLTAPAVTAGIDRIDLDQAVAVARADGLAGELTVSLPAGPDRPLKVAESSPGPQVDTIAIDPGSGDVTGRVGWDDYPLLAKLTTLGIDAHSGTLFGLANQILLALLAAAAVALLVLGYRMWWRRRPAPVPVPVWSQASWPTVFALVGVAVVLAWAMPVFGASLLAFVLLDPLVRRVRRGSAAGAR
ncbi:PepSY domain-containing protein [Actinokineospora sp. UTMC 2448]|uniref:PepSY-associated TM helix domain-containing protein n=1 Tax=Actinokineospora sp. UTMC 2448 TaxID=2268449 RepID=UPI002164C8C1|nr:PepSY domain-containing protein [Actinokineospora sp. UTMC 2448]